MPMAEPEEFGTEACGGVSQEYCCYCYQQGKFEDANMTLEEMIEACAPFLIESGEAKDADTARAMLKEFLPELKRWKKGAQCNKMYK